MIPFLPFLVIPGMGGNVSIPSPGTSIVGYNHSTTLSDIEVGAGGGGGDKTSTANNSVVSKSSAFDFKGSPRGNNKIWPSDLPGGEQWTPFTQPVPGSDFAEHKAMPSNPQDNEQDPHSSSSISHLLWPTNWGIEVLYFTIPYHALSVPISF